MHHGQDTHTHIAYLRWVQVSYCPCQATDNLPYLAYHDSGCIPTDTIERIWRDVHVTGKTLTLRDAWVLCGGVIRCP